MTLDPLDSALYRELVPHRITRAAPNACHDGPTAGWAELELRRELWALSLDCQETLPPLSPATSTASTRRPAAVPRSGHHQPHRDDHDDRKAG